MPNGLKGRHAVAVMTNAIEEVHTNVDRSIASNAALIARMMAAREEIACSGTIAQAELEHMHAGLGALISVRSHFIDNHARLAELGRGLGLEVRADGGLPKYPTHGQIEHDERAQAA